MSSILSFRMANSFGVNSKSGGKIGTMPSFSINCQTDSSYGTGKHHAPSFYVLPRKIGPYEYFKTSGLVFHNAAFTSDSKWQLLNDHVKYGVSNS